MFVYWTINNFLLLGQQLLFNWDPARKFLGIMEKPPARKLDKQPRPGLWGMVLDRQELIRTAWRSYVQDVEKRRAKLNKSVMDADADGEVRYESRRRGNADMSARDAGKIEKLK